MGYQVIRQPDGLLAVFSSFTDTWAVYDAGPGEVVDWFAEQAAKSADRDAERIVNHVLTGKARDVYFQFTMSFEQANAKSREHDGVVWSGGWPEGSQETVGADPLAAFLTSRMGEVGEAARVEVARKLIARYRHAAERANTFASAGWAECARVYRNALAIVATEFSDHPDYRQEWKP